MDYRWRCHPINQFAHFRQQWDNLNRQNGNTPLLDSRFIQPLLTHFSQGKELLAVAHHGETPVALAILVQTARGRWQTFQPSQAPLGCWLQQRNVPTRTLADSLRRALPGINLLLSITQQDPDLLAPGPVDGQFQYLDYIDTARITVTGSFSDYWDKRGKNLRQNLRKQRNRLAREGINTQLHQLTQITEVDHAIAAYARLESAGWKSEHDTAIEFDNPQGRFYRQMLSNFAADNQLMIYQFFYNEQLVATDLCIYDTTQLIILKTTYDETIRISSPALLMRQEAFEQLFNERRIARIEFYGKVMDWHTKWSDEIRRMYHINAYSLVGSLLKRLTS